VGRAWLLREHLSGLNCQSANLNSEVLIVIGIFSWDILIQKIGTTQKKKKVF
jgi:hypothetical protein